MEMATKRKEPESQRISWFLYSFELPLLCMSAKRYSIAGRISVAKRFDFLNFYPALQEYVHRLFAYGALSFDLDDTSREEPDYLCDFGSTAILFGFIVNILDFGFY